MVRHSSAKGIYGGSIPPQASRQMEFGIDNIFLNCPSGGTGIRARLKIVSRRGCGFDSHLGHYTRASKFICLLVGSERIFVIERSEIENHLAM